MLSLLAIPTKPSRFCVLAGLRRKKTVFSARLNGARMKLCYIQMCGYVSIGRIPQDKDSRTLLVDASKSNGMVLLELSHNNRSG